MRVANSSAGASDTTNLIEYVLNEHRNRDDAFGSMIQLCCKLTGDSGLGETEQERELVQNVVSEAFKYFFKTHVDPS